MGQDWEWGRRDGSGVSLDEATEAPAPVGPAVVDDGLTASNRARPQALQPSKDHRTGAGTPAGDVSQAGYHRRPARREAPFPGGAVRVIDMPKAVTVPDPARPAPIPESPLNETEDRALALAEGMATPEQALSGRAAAGRWSNAIRRAISLVVGGVGLLVTGVLLWVPIAIGIKLDSRGPVFHTQKRVGRDGRLFTLLKFRSMRADEGDEGDVWNRSDEHRITRFGRFLRKFYLDELPQFLNVLRGDMNIVGPRPELARNVPAMTQEIPHFGLRTLQRPGLTGWAQIKQGYAVDKIAVTEKVDYDLYYIAHASPQFDLKIMLRTIGVVLFGWHGGDASR